MIPGAPETKGGESNVDNGEREADSAELDLRTYAIVDNLDFHRGDDLAALGGAVCIRESQTLPCETKEAFDQRGEDYLLGVVIRGRLVVAEAHVLGPAAELAVVNSPLADQRRQTVAWTDRSVPWERQLQRRLARRCGPPLPNPVPRLGRR
jgi:hypothetical protein